MRQRSNAQKNTEKVVDSKQNSADAPRAKTPEVRQFSAELGGPPPEPRTRSSIPTLTHPKHSEGQAIAPHPNRSEPIRTVPTVPNLPNHFLDRARPHPNRSLDGACRPTPKPSECLCLHIQTDPNTGNDSERLGSVRMWRHKHSESLGVGPPPSREQFETVWIGSDVEAQAFRELRGGPDFVQRLGTGRNGSERFGTVRNGSDRFGSVRIGLERFGSVRIGSDVEPDSLTLSMFWVRRADA